MKKILLTFYITFSLIFGIQDTFAIDYSKISGNQKIVSALAALESINRKDVIAILNGHNATRRPI